MGCLAVRMLHRMMLCSRSDSLPPGERFTFGGARFGRAFDPASLIGDSGAADFPCQPEADMDVSQ